MIDFMNIGENISDEMLAAYIDGNATLDERSMIQNSIENDELLAEAIDIVNDSTSFGNSDWESAFVSNGNLELMLSPNAGIDNLFSFGIKDQSFEGDNLFGSSFDFSLAAADPTNIEDDDRLANDDSEIMSSSEIGENTDDISNMDI